MSTRNARGLLLFTIIRRGDQIGTVMKIDYNRRAFLVIWGNVRLGEWISFSDAKEITLL
jgi:hypothetical protein